MEFEDILKDVGDFGKFQKRLVIALIPAFFVSPWFCLNTVFMSVTPNHWCHVPEVSRSNLSIVDQRRLIRPSKDPFCSMNDVNYSSLLATGDWETQVHTEWPTKPCSDGWQFDTSDFDATASTRWNMVCDDAHYASLFLAATFVGDIIGTPIYGVLSDRFGRKPIFLFLAVLTSLSEIASSLSPNFVLFLVFRAVNGSSMSTIYGATYIILLELVSPEKRALMNGITTTSWTLGLCALPFIAWLIRNWLYLSFTTSAASLAQLLYWKILPESPSWLISRRNYEKAEKILTRISKSNGKVVADNQLLIKLQKLGESLKKAKMETESNSPLDYFRYPELRRRFLLVSTCWMGNSIAYFGLQMNTKNLAGSEFINFFLVSLVEIPAHLATWFVMQRFGRRWCSVVAFGISGTACLLPVFFLSEENRIIGVVASLFGKAGSSSAFMTLYQQCPELYPTPLRSQGMGMSCTIATLSTLSVPYIVYLARYGESLPFLTISLISFSSGLCASFLPETLNQKMPQSVADVENVRRRKKFFTCSEKRHSVTVEEPSPEVTSVKNNDNAELSTLARY